MRGATTNILRRRRQPRAEITRLRAFRRLKAAAVLGYSDPESHHVGVRLVRADGGQIWFRENESWPPKIIGAQRNVRSIEGLEVLLWTADGKAQVAAVRSANMGLCGTVP